MTRGPTEIVRSGYDVMADRFLAWRDAIEGDPSDRWAGELVSRLRPGARVLELGCGAGVPHTKRLAETFEVTGVDVSPAQIERAQVNVPRSRFIVSDFTELDIEPSSYDAVASFYALNHVPRGLLAPLFGDIHTWLAPGGVFLTALGIEDEEAWTGEWLGVPMFFSSFPRETNSTLLDEAGFERLLDEVVTFHKPEGDVAFQWVLARR